HLQPTNSLNHQHRHTQTHTDTHRHTQTHTHTQACGIPTLSLCSTLHLQWLAPHPSECSSPHAVERRGAPAASVPETPPATHSGQSHAIPPPRFISLCLCSSSTS